MALIHHQSYLLAELNSNTYNPLLNKMNILIKNNLIMANITDNNFNIDFNYPSLQRKDLMALSTITNNDASIKKFKQLDTRRDWSTNNYNLDIEGKVIKIKYRKCSKTIWSIKSKNRLYKQIR